MTMGYLTMPIVLNATRDYSQIPDATHKKSYKIEISTENYDGQTVNVAGKGTVCLRFYGGGQVSEVKGPYSGSRFGRGSTRSFDISTPIRIEELEVWIKREGNDSNLKWFVAHITCTEKATRSKQFFPIRRWVTMRHQLIRANDSLLPQSDPSVEQRREGIQIGQGFFYFQHAAGGIPTMTNLKNPAERFSRGYFNVVQAYMNIFQETDVDSEDQFDQTELDKLFGAQRLTGTNPAVIERVRELHELTKIMKVQPANEPGADSPATRLEDLLKPHMGMGLEDAIKEGKLYQVDYTEVLYDVKCETNLIAAPIALFFVNSNNDLMPIAIQLFKTRHTFTSGIDNPVFTPDDDSYTWLLAKMWFNNADASYHQSVSHLGFTHLLMETVYLGLRQTVSLSHPLYRLMAPHFLFVLGVNNEARDLLLNKGGWVDQEMTIGVKGLLEIMRRRYEGTDTVKAWSFDQEGNIENDIKRRGVENLPKYSFRDDALELRQIIKKYVTTSVELTYKGDPKNIAEDHEIQAWAEIMIKDTTHGGCGIKGLPFEEENDETDSPVKPENGDATNYRVKQYFKTQQHVIDTISTVIYTCSVAHAAVNFLQYENYAFPLNYPAILYGDPPRNRPNSEHNDIVKRNADDIMQALPTMRQTLKQ